MKIILCIIVITCIKEIPASPLPLHKSDRLSALRLINTSSDIVQHTDRQYALLNGIRKTNSKNAAFEIGFLTYIIQEKYRRMIDRYNISQTLKTTFYLMDHIMALEDIEHLYWDVGNIANMLHEIERKYDILTPLDEEYDDGDVDLERDKDGNVIETTTAKQTNETTTTKKKTRRPKSRRTTSYSDLLNITASPPKKQNKNKWWPVDYGWEIDTDWA